MKNKYKIAEIAIEMKDGKPELFWVYNAGYHPGQGGMELTWGSRGVKDLQTAISLLQSKLNKDIGDIVDDINNRGTKDD